MNPKVDPAKTRLAKELKHTAPLFGCRFDPTGTFVFAGAQDNDVHRWELDTGKKATLKGHKSWVRGLAFSDDGKTLWTAGYDGKVIAWDADADNPTPKQTLDAHAGWVRALVVSPDGKLLATCGNDNLVKLWSLPEGKRVRTLEGHSRHAYNVAFHPDGKSLVSGDLMGVIKHWEVETGKLVRDLDAGVLTKFDPTFVAQHGGIRAFSFRGDGGLLACAGITEVSNAFAGVGKPLAVVFDWKTGKQSHGLKPKDAFQGTLWGVVFHPDGFVIGAGGGSGGALWFWKPEEAQSFHTVKLPNNARDLDLHPDAARLAVPFYDGALRVYDMTAAGK